MSLEMGLDMYMKAGKVFIQNIPPNCRQIFDFGVIRGSRSERICARPAAHFDGTEIGKNTIRFYLF